MLILTIFFSLLLIELILNISLELANIKTGLKCKSVPAFLNGITSDEDFRKSVSYTKAKSKLDIVILVFNAALITVLIFTHLFSYIEIFFDQLKIHSYIKNILFIYSAAAIFSILSMPFSIYSEFVIEKQYGFSNMSVKMYIADNLKSILIGLVISFPLLLVLFVFMDKTGAFWWIFAFVFMAVFQLIISVLYPMVIAPIFNKFSRLEEGELKERLYALSKKLKFEISGLYVVDSSKRSSHSNAYFTGFGKAKRIVLYDTLINSISPAEIEAVLAHEIGHYKKHHILKTLISSLFIMLIAFFIISKVIDYAPLYNAFGFNAPGYGGIIIILMFFSSPFTFYLGPIFNYFSRKNEYEADRFAITSTENRENLKNALLKLGKENLSNPVPNKFYSFYHYSHPVLEERLSAIDKISL